MIMMRRFRCRCRQHTRHAKPCRPSSEVDPKNSELCP